MPKSPEAAKSKSELKEEIITSLETLRPNLTKSSAKTYASVLSNLLDKVNVKQYEIDSFMKHKAKILKYFKNSELSLQTKKTTLSALFVLTNHIPYRTLMIELANEVNEMYKTQKLSKRQEAANISFDDVKEKLAELKTEMETHKDEETYVSYLLLGFMSGIYTPPRRNEIFSIKKRNYDPDTDNYIKGNSFIYNTYKTSKKYGRQEVKIPKELLQATRAWFRKNSHSDYLFTHKGKEMKSSQMTVRLNKIFDGRKISANDLRRIFLTEYYKDMPKLNEMEDLATAMGHSHATSLSRYVKMDSPK